MRLATILSLMACSVASPSATAAGGELGRVQIRKRITATGVVRTVEPGWLTVENEAGQRARFKVQTDAAAGLLLEGTGVVVDFPCTLRIRGELPARQAPIGCRLRCVVDMARNQRLIASPVSLLELQPSQELGVRWQSAVRSRCEVVGVVVKVVDDVLQLHTGQGSLSVPLAPAARCVVETNQLQWVRPGDQMERLHAVKLSSGDWVVQSADVMLVDVSRRPLPAASNASTIALAARPRYFRSQHLLLRTDLPQPQAEKLIASLERICEMLGRHFGQSPKRPLRCMIVQDPKLWDEKEFEPTGWQKILANGGVTVTERMGREATAVVYAAAREKVVRHEIVHAFCAQTFGDTGPTWYAEGLAELGSYWEGDPSRVICDPVITDFIRTSPPRTLASIVAERQGTGESWRAYAWRWAACQLLACNPNYAHEFSGFGKELMEDGAASFQQYWGGRGQQAAFEFQQLIQHVGVGYNHSLCAWDWNTPFAALAPDRVVKLTVHARRGWQATGCEVEAGRSYDFAASGTWQVDDYRRGVDANGWPRGEGRMVGAILSEHTNHAAGTNTLQLHSAFRLGERGAFIAPQSGKLYVRCSDAWTQLDDNQGQCSLWLRQRP